MDHLLGKTKGRDGEYYKLVSRCVVFSLPDNLGNIINYEPGYILDEEEWFIIENFDQKNFCLELLRDRFVSAHYANMPLLYNNKIAYLVYYNSNNRDYFFQKVTRSQIVEKKWISLNTFQFHEDNSILIINNTPDAIYRKSENRLYFKRLSTISSIFKGIDQLYREATQEETEDFLNLDFIEMGDDFDAYKVKKANRKRIAMALDTLQNLNSSQKMEILTYVREYRPEIQFDEDQRKFKIEDENTLKALLYGIEQRYYTTVIGNEKRLANSVQTLTN